jgi:hypothetical protein
MRKRGRDEESQLRFHERSTFPPANTWYRVKEKLSVLELMDYSKVPSSSRLLSLLNLKTELEQSDNLDFSSVEAIICTLRKFETIREREIFITIIEFVACALLRQMGDSVRLMWHPLFNIISV